MGSNASIKQDTKANADAKQIQICQKSAEFHI